jgi:hypothetical protein
MSWRQRRGDLFVASPGRWTSSQGSRRNCLGDKQKTYLPVGRQGTSASADNANDAVQVDETVRMPQDLTNGIEFKGIDVRID